MEGKTALVLRNLVFGVEDSLVSTVGLLSGIAVAGVPRKTIFLTGVILVMVEALSMAVGSYLSETSVQEYHKKENTSFDHSLVAGIVMFASYLVAGLVPLVPYLIVEGTNALILSITATLVVLFLLGAASGRVTGVSTAKSGLRMLLLGGGAIVLGVVVGNLLE